MNTMNKKEYSKPEIMQLNANLTDGGKGTKADVENPGTKGNGKSPS